MTYLVRIFVTIDTGTFCAVLTPFVLCKYVYNIGMTYGETYVNLVRIFVSINTGTFCVVLTPFFI